MKKFILFLAACSIVMPIPYAEGKSSENNMSFIEFKSLPQNRDFKDNNKMIWRRYRAYRAGRLEIEQ